MIVVPKKLMPRPAKRTYAYSVFFILQTLFVFGLSLQTSHANWIEDLISGQGCNPIITAWNAPNRTGDKFVFGPGCKPPTDEVKPYASIDVKKGYVARICDGKNLTGRCQFIQDHEDSLSLYQPGGFSLSHRIRSLDWEKQPKTTINVQVLLAYNTSFMNRVNAHMLIRRTHQVFTRSGLNVDIKAKFHYLMETETAQITALPSRDTRLRHLITFAKSYGYKNDNEFLIYVTHNKNDLKNPNGHISGGVAYAPQGNRDWNQAAYRDWLTHNAVQISYIHNSGNTIAHELGHNLGLSHGHSENANEVASGYLKPYARGFYDQVADTGSIMHYNGNYNLFSNPKISCVKKANVDSSLSREFVPCGTDNADAVRAMKETSLTWIRDWH